MRSRQAGQGAPVLGAKTTCERAGPLGDVGRVFLERLPVFRGTPRHGVGEELRWTRRLDCLRHARVDSLEWEGAQAGPIGSFVRGTAPPR